MNSYYKKNKEKIKLKSRKWAIENRARSNYLKIKSYHKNKKLKITPKLIPGIKKFISRQEALKKGLKTYFNGRPCKKGHITKRNVKDKRCPICQKFHFENWSKKNKKKLSESIKNWRSLNPNYQKDYRKKNYKKFQELDKKDRIKRKDYFSKYSAEYKLKRRSNDPAFKLITNMRSRIRSYLTANVSFRKKSKTMDLLGCTSIELKRHLEKRFKPGMNWKNNTINGWHVDHIKPLTLAKSYKQLEKLCHYTNLQPLWANENIKKGNKLK